MTTYDLTHYDKKDKASNYVFFGGAVFGFALAMLVAINLLANNSPPLSVVIIWLICIFTFMFSGSLAAVGIYKLLELQKLEAVWEDEEPESEPTAGTYMDFSVHTNARPATVEANGNTIQVSTFKQFKPNHWRVLRQTMARNKWEWRKKPLARAKLFTVPVAGINITEPGAYEAITEECRRMRWLEPDPDKPDFYNVSEYGQDVWEKLSKLPRPS